MSELRKKYELLFAEKTEFVPDKARDIKESLYGNLTILDSKASALMAFDGILIAAATFAFPSASGLQWWALLIGIVMALTAAGFCLGVAQVSYPFLGKVAMTPARPAVSGGAETPARLDFSNELDALDDAVKSRTCFYRIAWWLSLGTVILVPTMFIISFVL